MTIRSRPEDPTVRLQRYDTPTVVLHWLTACLVALLWVIGQTRSYVPRGALRTDYISLHIVLGVALALVLLVRVVWRLERGRMLPPDEHWVLALAARVTHFALYLLVIAAVLLGLATMWSRGSSIFGLFHIPKMPGTDNTLDHQIFGWHALAANAVLIVAGLHAAAALAHHYVLRDDVLARMVPFVRRGPTSRQLGRAPTPGE